MLKSPSSLCLTTIQKWIRVRLHILRLAGLLAFVLSRDPFQFCFDQPVQLLQRGSRDNRCVGPQQDQYSPTLRSPNRRASVCDDGETATLSSEIGPPHSHKKTTAAFGLPFLCSQRFSCSLYIGNLETQNFKTQEMSQFLLSLS